MIINIILLSLLVISIFYNFITIKNVKKNIDITINTLKKERQYYVELWLEKCNTVKNFNQRYNSLRISHDSLRKRYKNLTDKLVFNYKIEEKNK